MAQESPGTAVITGASSGLGVEFARQLAGKGYDVVLVARRKERLDAVASEVRALGRRADVVVLDLSAPGAARALVSAMEALGVTPALLVNNAGVGLYGLALEQEPASIDAVLRLNVLALTELCVAFGRRMAERGEGSILNVSSTASFQPDPYMAAYGASKAYVTSFSLALAEELGPRGVRVLTHCPGLTRTEFNTVAGVHAKNDADWMYMSAADCVAVALRGLQKGRRLVIAGLLNRVAAWSTRLAPVVWVTRTNGRILAPKA